MVTITTKPIFENVKGKNTVLKTSGILLLILQIVMTALYFYGLVDYYGSAINVKGALDILFSIVNITSSTIFECLLKLVLSIMFIVHIIRNIKAVVTSISAVMNITYAKNEEDNKKLEISFFTLLENVCKPLQNGFVFIMFATMISVDFSINSNAIALLILGGFCYILSSAILGYLKNYHYESIVYRSFATLIMMVSFILMISKLQIPTIEQVLQAGTKLFGGYYVSFSMETILKVIKDFTFPIIYMILQFNMMRYLPAIWGYDFYQSSESGKNVSRSIMGLIITIVICKVVINFDFLEMEIENISSLLKPIGKDLGFLLSGIVLFVSYHFENHFKTNNSKLGKTEGSVVTQSNVPKSKNIKQIEVQTPEQKNNSSNSENDKKQISQKQFVAELIKCKELLNEGAITQEEFEAIKKQLIGL